MRGIHGNQLPGFSFNVVIDQISMNSVAHLPIFAFILSSAPSADSMIFFQGSEVLIPGLGRSLGEEDGNPLQYSCLENSIDRGAWRATVHGVAKSQTRQRPNNNNKTPFASEYPVLSLKEWWAGVDVCV